MGANSETIDNLVASNNLLSSLVMDQLAPAFWLVIGLVQVLPPPEQQALLALLRSYAVAVDSSQRELSPQGQALRFASALVADPVAGPLSEKHLQIAEGRQERLTLIFISSHPPSLL